VPNLTYHPLERLRVPRPVDRYEYVRERCRGRRVLDLGAYDETEVVKNQHQSWRWLHAEIASSAREVLGVDASPKLPEDGLATRVGTRIVRGGVDNLDAIVDEFAPDLIVAGEIVEHTQDTLGWLARLARVAPGTAVLLTTPNATSIINILLAGLSRENNHEDHLHIYSYKTMTTLAKRIPIDGLQLTPYYYDPHIFRGRLPRLFGPVVTLANAAILKPAQFLFPLTAFGWIVEGTLGTAAPQQ
jgi:hypothetical protein